MKQTKKHEAKAPSADDVLRRMLSTPPAPFTPPAKPKKAKKAK